MSYTPLLGACQRVGRRYGDGQQACQWQPCFTDQISQRYPGYGINQQRPLGRADERDRGNRPGRIQAQVKIALQPLT
ncbi:hypothetical protein D3C76_451380 [compost metagenome]